jgi:adenylyl cyclase-associated protein
MEEKLIERLESAVARLEALSLRSGGVALSGGDDTAATEPSIVAFDDFIGTFFVRVSSAAEKIGGQVLEVTRILEQALNVQKELLIKIKQTRVLIYLLCFGGFSFNLRSWRH